MMNIKKEINFLFFLLSKEVKRKTWTNSGFLFSYCFDLNIQMDFSP